MRRLCDAHGGVLICDDVRSSFRLDLAGSWAQYSVEPDLTCLCKGIANGYPLACVLGSERLREGVRSMAFMTGSFWCNADAFSAALATVRTLQRTGGIAQMAALGQRLCDGVVAQAAAVGLELRVSGPPQMPLFDFPAEAARPMAERAAILRFCSECAQHGIWFHPFHTMFLSAAHTDADVTATLRVTRRALEVVAAAGLGRE